MFHPSNKSNLIRLAGIWLFCSAGFLAAQPPRYAGDPDLTVTIPDRFSNLTKKLTDDRQKMDIRLMPLLEAEYLADDQTIDSYKDNLEQEAQFIRAGEADFSEGAGAGDMVYVYVEFGPGGSDKTIDSLVRLITDYDRKNRYAVAWVEVINLDALVALKKVNSVRTVARPLARTGSALTEGDAIHRTDDVRSIYGQQGAGVKIGIISDGVDHRSSAQATDDLPEDGSGLTVLGNAVGGDEGTAMLEIVHDMVSGADLFFHDCGVNTSAFNQAIDDLIAAGCQVICDDIGWITQPFFEDGIVASHVASALASNDIIYVSSAGNSAAEHYQGGYLAIPSSTQHDFSNGGGTGYYYLYLHMQSGDAVRIVLQWNDQFGTSGNDYNLYLYNLNTSSVVAYSTNVQNGNDNPIEYVSYTSASTADFAIIVNKASGSAKTLEVFAYPSGNAYMYIDNVSEVDAVFGHAAVTGVIAAGAIRASDPLNDDIEYFSSQGPSTITFPASETRSKPDLCGIDGVAVTGAGGFSNPFYGTSAAAPHAAAVAAQLWAQLPSQTGNQIRDMIKATAVDLGDTGSDYVFGSGRADALNAFFAYVQSEIDIQRPLETPIADGGTDAAGSTAVGPDTLTYSVINTGTYALGVSGVTASNLVNTGAFSVVTPMPLSVAVDDTAELAVSFSVLAAGAFGFDMDFASNDADENPYDIAVSGTGIAPEIAVQRPLETPIADGGTDAAGSMAVGPDTLTYSIINSGALALNISGVAALNLTNASAFAAVTPLPKTILAGDTAELAVSFSVDAAGAFGFDMGITSDDADENPYDIAVSGTGINPFIYAKVKVFLEGPYLAGGTMTANLKSAGSIPTTSPYADARVAAAVPDGVTDWISVELRVSVSGPSDAQKSFFLKNDGSIVDDDGTTADLEMPEIAAGAYYILIRHRNHIAVMSASAQALDSSGPPLYDFTTGLGQYYGTDANRAKQVQTGVYGMNAGDTNNTGTVDANDRSSAWNNRNKTGYESADCNLSGTVDANDRSTAWNNRNKTTSVP